jgi:hypothetical protein
VLDCSFQVALANVSMTRGNLRSFFFFFFGLYEKRALYGSFNVLVYKRKMYNLTKLMPSVTCSKSSMQEEDNIEHTKGHFTHET